MRAFMQPFRRACPSCSVDECTDAFRIICLARYQDLKVIRKTDEPTIKHPMSRSGKCDSIAHDIRAIGFNRANMSCGNLGTSPAIDQLQSRKSAPLIISSKNNTAKHSVAYYSRCHEGQALTVLLKLEWCLHVLESARTARIVDAGQNGLGLAKAQLKYATKILRRNWANSRLSAPRDSSLLVQQAPFNRSGAIGERHRGGKIKIGSGFHKRQVHTGRRWVRDNRLDLGNCKIAARLDDLSRLVIDNPIANARLNAAKILGWELIPRRRAIVIDGVVTVDEYAKGHAAMIASIPLNATAISIKAMCLPKNYALRINVRLARLHCRPRLPLANKFGITDFSYQG